MAIDLTQFDREEYCYLTTRGRKTGSPHEIEIWFVVYENSLYLMSGSMDKSDWVKNLLQEPNATIRIAGQTFPVVASLLEDKAVEPLVRMAMAIKYNEWEGSDPSEWAQTALVVKFKV
ncbi:MAG: nitroreductase family deazaflavin-dependent oxidoreductase [Chloroflexi bacterium]|nr:nitroreductase family deazaflavin-dependent oxidoreductase [Chloroflexota bacterium]MBI3169121.1 nitroreductase family deazaflavin-dependent oxidoreductase [Chloroflexota bacterium]